MTFSITISKRILSLTVLLILLLGAVSLAFASHNSNIVHACLKKDGSITIVNDATDCKPKDDPITLATEGAIEALEVQNAALQTRLDNVESRVAALENLLVHFARNGDDVIIAGANLHIVNGLGNTQSTNSLGNVIIGYNELRGSDNDRSGSHMLVVGEEQNYSSFGGIVVGFHNETSGDYSSVSGGVFNTASGDNASVTGGRGNRASGIRSSVTGGDDNEASGFDASVTGGNENIAIGNAATVSGGFSRSAPLVDSWAAGSLFESN